MRADEQFDQRGRRRGGTGPLGARPEQRYWFGAPPREWMAVLFLPGGGAIVIAWLVHAVLRSDAPRTASWLAFALGLGGGFVAGFACTLRLALERRLFLRDAVAIARDRSRVTTVGVPLGIAIALVVALLSGALQVAFLAGLAGAGRPRTGRGRQLPAPAERGVATDAGESTPRSISVSRESQLA